MRRGRRAREKSNNFKYLLYLSGGLLVILIVTFIATFISYNNKLKNSSNSILSMDSITGLVPNEEEGNELEQASSEIGKTIEEAINSIENANNVTQENTIENTTNSTNTSTQEKSTTKTTTETEQVKDPEFTRPVEGEILRAYARDNLVYSETLQEWVVHLGIDIKADRTTIVKAAEAGTIQSIKNDPRYGLTIVIEHVNGFKTVYSNLLTTEFVSQGEKVEKGQSIGTVGNSSSFEIIDEPHLHFEILKDDVNADPTLYLK